MRAHILPLLLLIGLHTAQCSPSASKQSEYIIVFKKSNGVDPQQSIRAAQFDITKQRVGKSQPNGTLPDWSIPFVVLTATSAAPETTDGYTFPVKTATIRIEANEDHGNVIGTLLARADVEGVYPNRIYKAFLAHTPSDCAATNVLNGIVPSTTFVRWDFCLTAATELIWYGQMCGDDKENIQWTGVYAARKADHAPVFGCRITTSTPGYGVGTPSGDTFLGRCGVPPRGAPSLPQRICRHPPSLDSPPPTPPSTSAPKPSPWLDPPNMLPREPLKKGEASLRGMERIQATTSGRVPVPPPTSIIVAVLDTGGTTLTDLNTIAGQTFVGGDRLDHVGHGTHVAGIIGARNNGKGVYGALPNIRILPLKVLSDSGTGTMSDTMMALEYVAKNAPTKNIGVVNLSLGGNGASSDPIWDAISAVVARGVVVVVAAGNTGTNLQGYSPAACESAITVTAISAYDDTPASFSNWLPASASEATKSRIVAAPGVDILSTFPDGSLKQLSGTSMAAPHVTGVAARCFADGDCKVGDAFGYDNTQKVLDVIWKKYASDSLYGWNKGGKQPVQGDKYYGPLVWGNKW